jgi:uncharacterized protein (DUF433 family)
MRPLHAAYEAKRAAALAGVPERTVYHWAHEGIWVPALAHKGYMRWSYSDLLGLRLIDWLRKAKPDLVLPATSMGRVRDLLGAVEDLGERLATEDVEVWVDEKGGLVVRLGDMVAKPVHDEILLPTLLPLIDLGPVNLVRAWGPAPDLLQPRETLRIVPGKVSGEPHVVDTRLQTNGIYVLKRERHLPVASIVELYPFLSQQNVDEAIDLEEQLSGRRPIAA